MTWIPTITSAVDFCGPFFLWLVSITKAPGITLAFIVPGITRYSFFPLATWSSNMGRGFFNSNHSFSAWIIVTFSPSPSHQYNSFFIRLRYFLCISYANTNNHTRIQGENTLATHHLPCVQLIATFTLVHHQAIMCAVHPFLATCVHLGLYVSAPISESWPTSYMA